MFHSIDSKIFWVHLGPTTRMSNFRPRSQGGTDGSTSFVKYEANEGRTRDPPCNCNLRQVLFRASGFGFPPPPCDLDLPVAVSRFSAAAPPPLSAGYLRPRPACVPGPGEPAPAARRDSGPGEPAPAARRDSGPGDPAPREARA